MKRASDKEMVEAFNEWMRQYEEDPEAFSNSLADVKAFLQEKSEGREPTYGAKAWHTLKRILRELRGA